MGNAGSFALGVDGVAVIQNIHARVKASLLQIIFDVFQIDHGSRQVETVFVYLLPSAGGGAVAGVQKFENILDHAAFAIAVENLRNNAFGNVAAKLAATLHKEGAHALSCRRHGCCYAGESAAADDHIIF